MFTTFQAPGPLGWRRARASLVLTGVLGSQSLLQVDASPAVLRRDLHLLGVLFSWTLLHPEVPRVCLEGSKPQLVQFLLLHGNCLGKEEKRSWVPCGVKVGKLARVGAGKEKEQGVCQVWAAKGRRWVLVSFRLSF